MISTNLDISYLQDDVLNKGMELHLEFGENWLKDIDQRLSVIYPNLSKNELRKVDAVCRKISKTANDFINSKPKQKDGKITFIDFNYLKNFMIKKHH